MGAAMTRIAIVTNMWDIVSPALGEARVAELKSNEPLLFKHTPDLGAKFYRNNRPPKSALKIVRDLVGWGLPFLEPVQLAIQQELARGIQLLQTSAGEAMNYEVARKRAEHDNEIKILNQQYEKARQDHDTEALEEIEQERNLMKRKLEELKLTETRLREQAKHQINRGPLERVTYGIPPTSLESNKATTEQGRSTATGIFSGVLG
ncbi:hypothetical protein OPQ81_008135 [Rhizoctonia solani]|nr:hypothetical protein OPQ81_008135 [Rhizoctonia solani]